MEHLHFAGFSHSDQIEIYVFADRSVQVTCWNDGYPNRMGGGSSTMDMPTELARNYDQKEFVRWLQDNFWNTTPVEIYRPAEESVVKEFFKNALSEA